MAISGVGQSYYQNNVATTKSTKSVNSTGETGNTKELSEAEEMAIFKKEFYAEIDKIPRNRTITNVAINISEEAFKNMKDDPEYREKILSALKRDLTSSFAPLEASMVLTVGATAKDYRGDSWSGVNNQSEFYARSQNSFYKKTSNKKDRQKELLEEYLEKRAQVKKQQQEMKRLQSRNRKEADYYGRGTMKGCCQKRLMLMKQDTKRQLLKVDKEASAAREKAYQDYVMQYEMAVAKQQSEAWRKAIDGVPDSLRMLLEINNTENVPEYSEKQKSNITMQSRLMIIPVTV